jgi:NADH:ubiquinone oxidoreductase subunit E
MTRADRVRRAVFVGSAAIGAICIGMLVADYAVARWRAPRDAARVAELQLQVRSDAAVAPVLAAEQDRITRARRARKARTDALAVLLIAAASAFVATTKWRMAQAGPRPQVTLIPLSSLRSAPAPPATAATIPPGAAPAVPPAPETPAIDLSIVDRIVAAEGRSTEAAIPILQAIQAHFRYLPDEALRRVCELTDITPAQIAGTSSFYSRFRRSPVGDHVIRVCHGTACHVSGARQITEELRRQLRIPDGADTDPARQFTLDEVACLGCCSLAPVLMVDDHTAGRLTPADAVAALDVVRRRRSA